MSGSSNIATVRSIFEVGAFTVTHEFIVLVTQIGESLNSYRGTQARQGNKQRCPSSKKVPPRSRFPPKHNEHGALTLVKVQQWSPDTLAESPSLCLRSKKFPVLKRMEYV